MSARKKLNGLYMIGCVMVAAFIGLMLVSWWAFGVTLVLAILNQIMTGNIRLASRLRV
jgi:hypothetical protein